MDPEQERWREECDRMVEQQIAMRGVADRRVLEAMREVPRHAFVPPDLRPHAYDDGALPIGRGQTISQPYIVAIMTEAARLRPGDRVLEIGTGSGYQAAILARLTDHVLSVERVPELARSAARTLRALDIPHVQLLVADGLEPVRADQCFHAVIVTAGAPSVPDSLRVRLTDQGRLVIPVGPRELQTLLVVERHGNSYTQSSLGSCVFVPLVGKSGWTSSS